MLQLYVDIPDAGNGGQCASHADPQIRTGTVWWSGRKERLRLEEAREVKTGKIDIDERARGDRWQQSE